MPNFFSAESRNGVLRYLVLIECDSFDLIDCVFLIYIASFFGAQNMHK
jgi:hypothetical protein